jgi:hypothetical protein
MLLSPYLSGQRWTLPLLILLVLLFPAAETVHGAVIDRVVASMDDEAITLRELQERYEQTKAVKPSLTQMEVLTTMINRRLLLREARLLRLEGDHDAVIQEYVELKVRAFIRTPQQDVEEFYLEHREQFGTASIEEVADQIRTYLEEREVNRRLREHIDELRKKARIRILLDPET